MNAVGKIYFPDLPESVKAVIDRMKLPTWMVLVQRPSVDSKTESGIIVTADTQQADASLAKVSKILRVGEFAFKGEWFTSRGMTEVPFKEGDVAMANYVDAKHHFELVNPDNQDEKLWFAVIADTAIHVAFDNMEAMQALRLVSGS